VRAHASQRYLVSAYENCQGAQRLSEAGEGFVRLSFANSDELLQKAVERTARLLRGAAVR